MLNPSKQAATHTSSRILVAEGQAEVLSLLQGSLEQLGHEVMVASDGPSALEALSQARADLLLLDLEIPGIDTEQLIQKAQQDYPGMPVIALADPSGDISTVVSRGAHDFLSKAPTKERLHVAVRNALTYGSLSQTIQKLQNGTPSGTLVGRDNGLVTTCKLVDKVTNTDLAVLLSGESGVGKQLIARTIHEQSPRGDKSLITLNCASMPESLLECELFGYVEGAVAGADRSAAGKLEAANGSTLLIENVDQLSPSAQNKLLRALQSKTVTRLGSDASTPINVRLICTTERDLGKLVETGRFREDLFYRVSVFPVPVPPLRERRGDVPELVHHILSSIGSNGSIPRIHPTVMSMLERYNWPGNVRELSNVLRRALVLSAGKEILPAHLPEGVQSSLSDTLAQTADRRMTSSTVGRAIQGWNSASKEDDSTLPTLEELERLHIMRSLEVCRGNLSQASRMLAIGRTTLYRKLQKYGIQSKA